MAQGGDEDRDSKTEHASERRLRQMHEDGNVPVGRDTAALGAFVAGVMAIKALGEPVGTTILALVQSSVMNLGVAPDAALWQRAGLLIFAISVVIALGGSIPLLVQTKGQVWANLAAPDFSRLWKPDKLTKFFRREGWVELGSALLKVGFLYFAARWAFDSAFHAMLQLIDAPANALVGTWLQLLLPACVRFMAALVVVGGIDVAVTRWKYSRDAMMTRDEIKREHKEDDGDPMMKSRRRKRAREILKHRVAVDVPRADAIIVNPTHIAIAIRYRTEEGGTPRVLAKGKGQLAETIRDIARANGIAIIEDIPLARLLFKRVKVGGFVPKETYKAVATVLAHVYRLQARARGAAGAHQ